MFFDGVTTGEEEVVVEASAREVGADCLKGLEAEVTEKTAFNW